jgi:hypothetical protein
MRGGGMWRGIGRGAFALLAFVALALIVAVPPGFMVGGGGDGGPARIVICTGHGPVETALDLGGKGAPAHGGKAAAPCAFAGHAAPLTPTPTAPAIAIAWSLTAAPQAIPASQVAIGRGLAAPPPARGPPSSLT